MLAQDLDAIQEIGLPNSKFGVGELGDIITNLKILDYVFFFSGILLLVYMISGGIQLMVSRGDPKAMQSAQGKITNALLGFVIVVGAFILVQFLGQIFNLEGTPFGKIFGL